MDEVTQTGTPVSTGSEVTSENKGTVTQGTPTNQVGSDVKSTEPQLIDISGWEGDLNSIPDSLPQKTKDTLKSWRQYFTKKTQEMADIKDHAQKYQEFVNSDTYKEFQSWYTNKNQQPNNSNPSNPYQQLGITQDELDAAQLGDSNALLGVINKVAEYKANQVAKEKEALVEQKLQVIDKRDEIRDFADTHADFWDVYDEYSDVMKGQLAAGKSIDKAYNHVIDLKNKYVQQAQKAAAEIVTQKKNASTIDGRMSGESDIIWADNEADANLKAMELVRTNDPRKVRIKKK